MEPHEEVDNVDLWLLFLFTVLIVFNRELVLCELLIVVIFGVDDGMRKLFLTIKRILFFTVCSRVLKMTCGTDDEEFFVITSIVCSLLFFREEVCSFSCWSSFCSHSAREMKQQRGVAVFFLELKAEMIEQSSWLLLLLLLCDGIFDYFFLFDLFNCIRKYKNLYVIWY